MPVMPSMPAVSPLSLVAAERPSATVKEKDCILRAVADDNDGRTKAPAVGSNINR